MTGRSSCLYMYISSRKILKPTLHHPSILSPFFANQYNMKSLLCLFNSQKSLRQRHAAATLCKFPSTLTYQFRQQHAFSRGY